MRSQIPLSRSLSLCPPSALIIFQVDEDLVDEEMRQNLQAAGAAGKASKGQVGSLVGMSSDEIAQVKKP